MRTHASNVLLSLALLVAVASCTGGGSGGAASGGAGASAGVGAGPSGGAATPMLRAGASRVDITPPVGAPLGGYGGGPRRALDSSMVALNVAALFNVSLPPTSAYTTLFNPSTGRKDGVFAKAIVYERAGGERYAVLGLDAIGVSLRARDEIARRAAASGVAPERLMIAATHSHSGPGGIADKSFWQVVGMDVLDARLFDALCSGAAAAIIDAASRMEPALLARGMELESGVQRNRRGLGYVDPELVTLGFVRPDGSTIGLMVNLAVHGICLDADNMEFSGDLMGYCEREVESALGAGAVCVYLNGAEGDVSPQQYGLAGAERLGRVIGAHAVSVHTGSVPSAVPDAVLDGSFESVRLRYAPSIDLARINAMGGAVAGATGSGQVNLSVLALAYGQVPIVFDERQFNRDIPVQALRIGDACLMGVPGEPLTNVGISLKAAAVARGFARPIVVGLANDHMGYVADPVEYDKGGYEATMTFFGRDTATELEAAITRQVDRIKP